MMLDSLVKHRILIVDIWRTDIKRKYAGTLLGPAWAIAPQILTVTAYWFVFQFGLKAQGPGNLPYFFYFAMGILPWFLFFDAFSSNVNAIRDNSHLITKMVFPSEILPAVNFLVSSIPHAALVLLVEVMLWSNNLLSPMHTVWLVYFYGCTAVLATGIGWMVSSISVFSRDVSHFAQTAIGLFFWVTPIMWQVDTLPDSARWVFEWNPLTYIVKGYRFALTGGMPPTWESDVKFWLICVALTALGSYVFSRLKPHFADVL